MGNLNNCSICGTTLADGAECWCRRGDGRTIPFSKSTQHLIVCMELQKLYICKNSDYGDSFGKGFAEYGMTMPVIRLEDKLNRIKSLIKNEAAVKDESLMDTLMDLANYSIMTIIELEGDKENE